MLPAQTPVLKDIVLIGAGHANVSVLRMFGMKLVPGVRLTLITRQVNTPYSGMLPGLIAGHYTLDETHIDTGPLCRFAGARLYQSEVAGIDLAKRRVLCADRPPVPYDLLSINIGSTPNTLDIPGAARGAIPVKPIDGFLKRFEAARQRILDKRGRAKVCVVGAGAGGVELLLSLQRRLRRDIAAAGFDPSGVSFSICTADAEILSAFPNRVRHRFRTIMNERGVTVITGCPVSSVDGAVLNFDGHKPLSFDEVFWATRAAAVPWLAKTGLKLDPDGFVETKATLESTSHEGIFAAGDVAAVGGYYLPKAGVYAVRQGPVLAENLRRAVAGKPLKTYRQQRNVLALISTGEPYAIGTRNGKTFEGAWIWRWKDWIDRRFMRKFNEFPEMPTARSKVSTRIADKG